MLTFVLDKPAWSVYGIVKITLPSDITSYSHKISATVGYDSASISFVVPNDGASMWLQTLGYDFVANNTALDPAWNGFVNKIEMGRGGETVTRGPLLDVANRVRAIYRTVRYDTRPPIGGQQAETDYADNASSQKRYSILSEDVSVSEADEAQAEGIRDTYLNEYGLPQTGHALSVGSSDSRGVTITLSLLGYYHRLDYKYTQTSTASQVNASDLMKSVLSADPNSIISTYFSLIDDNGVQVGEYEDGSRSAETIIKEIVSVGGTSGQRFLFGIYRDRVAIYDEIPDDIEYFYRSDDASHIILRDDAADIDYWDVLPGRWLSLSGTISTHGLELRDDANVMFIESVSFSMPNTLSLSGGKVDTFSQKLARLGLGGL
jgi:hypothetical protein